MHLAVVPVPGMRAASPEAQAAARRYYARGTGYRSANLDGAEALRRLGGGTLDGAVARDYLDRLDELERRSMNLELLDAYETALGVRLGGVDHRPGRLP